MALLSKEDQEKKELHCPVCVKGMDYQFGSMSKSVFKGFASFQCLMEK